VPVPCLMRSTSKRRKTLFEQKRHEQHRWHQHYTTLISTERKARYAYDTTTIMDAWKRESSCGTRSPFYHALLFRVSISGRIPLSRWRAGFLINDRYLEPGLPERFCWHS